MAQPKVQAGQTEWSSLDLKEGVPIQVSNPSLDVPEGLDVVPEFISQEESDKLLEQVDREEWIWDGFEQRRRLQTYATKDSSMPSLLKDVVNRFIATTGHNPQVVTVEEYPSSQLQTHFTTCRTTVTTFESSTPSKLSDTNSDCTYFAAALPITSSVVENINRPKRRTVDCWDLYSAENHSSGLVLSRRALTIKTKELLWEWRSRISAAGPPDQHDSDNVMRRFVLVKFRNLPDQPSADTTEDSEFGFVPKPEDLIPRTGDMPPLEDLLTVIVTTSPIKSNPSTELFERVFDTFFQGGNDFAIKCRKVIVCDGCRERTEKVTKRHANVKQAMRNGIVNSDQLENYNQFKAALRQLCATAPADSPFSNTHVEELETRHGYGFALRHALRECISTPFVIVIQHDRTFMRPTPILETVHTMWRRRQIKYVGISMRSNLMYRDHFLGKYGRSYMDDMASCILRPPELALDADMYGPDSHSTTSMDFAGQEKLRENILALVETYQTSQQNLDNLEWIESNPPPPGKRQLSLTPTFFWYDNVHICETAHYRDFVFNPKYKMVVKGGFVEDKLSPVIKKTVERLGLVQGHARFGCYLLDDHSGMFFTGHLDGGSYLTRSEKDAYASNTDNANKSGST